MNKQQMIEDFDRDFMAHRFQRVDDAYEAGWLAGYEAQQREIERLRDIIKEGIFNAESVISSMKEVRGGAGFSVSEEAEWIKKAKQTLAGEEGV